jgi:hypothetical protein
MRQDIARTHLFELANLTLIACLLQHRPSLCNSLVGNMGQVQDLSVLAAQSLVAFLKTVLADDLAVRAVDFSVAWEKLAENVHTRRGVLIFLRAESALAIEGSCNSRVSTFSFAVAFFSAVEACSTAVLSRLRAIAGEVTLCEMIVSYILHSSNCLCRLTLATVAASTFNSSTSTFASSVAICSTEAIAP